MLGGETAKRKGRLQVGMDADLVVFGKDGVVRSTWVMGKEVWGDLQPSSA
jgi:N-acetylglucosamine-6-phosphate deacetylase